MVKTFLAPMTRKPRAAVFVSGSGTNAERLLETLNPAAMARWEAAAMVTDNPATSRAGELAAAFGVELVALDIKEFYRARGEPRVSLLSERGRAIREEWTEELRGRLKPFDIDFGILAGFVPLCNITADFPCLNVHPGDLTLERDGRRLLVGLHTVPVEAAILARHRCLRSSVIVAQPYTGAGGGMDSGPVIGLSTQVSVFLGGIRRRLLHEAVAARPKNRPVGGYNDILEHWAKINLERLKVAGDWLVFPQAVADFAAGCFATENSGGLLFRQGEAAPWQSVSTVVYCRGGRHIQVSRRRGAAPLA